MSENTKQFFEAVNFATTNGHSILYWHGHVPKEALEIAGVSGSVSSKFFTIFGVRVEVKPVYTSEK